ncbi:helix-turn-helix domain-containing protein [Candidatus Stoquefichus massiliensis]|uniref:helix-turn-helix domain-containing protein n=1 Tax=Candidatus Stoquefichus massiliensis TaxID=1470350 RepID=UPI000487AE22|nr:helix-turn-helix transcriptional regulator [Candidatus Stoquefichus massiliensis]
MLNNIEAERVRKRLSQDELAKKMGISLKTYYNWINEETDIPSSALIKFAKLFKTDIDYLLENSKNFMGDNFMGDN